MPPCSAGSTISWPARRCRCAPSSRWPAPPPISPPSRPRRCGFRRWSRRCNRRTPMRGCALSSRNASRSGRGNNLPFVIAAPCIDVKDRTCLDACPVDCIYEGGRTLYIHPEECIDCGLCETVCPVDAIHADDRLPAELTSWIAVNREFFGPEVTGWGRPGGADAKYTTDKDHPVVAAWPVVRNDAEDGGSSES